MGEVCQTLLKSIIIETNIIEQLNLTRKEDYIFNLILNEDSNDLELNSIGQKTLQLLITKLQYAVKALKVKSIQSELLSKQNLRLKEEIKRLKKKFKNELEIENQAILDFEESGISLDKLNFSVRAKNALISLNVHNLNSLRGLTKKQLLFTNHVGSKTALEIIEKAAAIGVAII